MIKKIIGFLMIMSVFMAITLTTAHSMGWKATILIWIGSVVMTLIIVKGLMLLSDE